MYKVSTYNAHIVKQLGKVLVLALLLVNSSLASAQIFTADKRLFDAYQREDMSVWKAFLDSANNDGGLTPDLFSYEYGYCGYIVSKDKKAAKPYVKRFKQDVEDARQVLPLGHYEMWKSAVLVFEMRTKESFHPAKAMKLAKQATQWAPDDPLVLSYYATSLFYAPKPFGSKSEALEYFQKAEVLFRAPEYKFCWLREATLMYIDQCREKLNK